MAPDPQHALLPRDLLDRVAARVRLAAEDVAGLRALAADVGGRRPFTPFRNGYRADRNDPDPEQRDETALSPKSRQRDGKSRARKRWSR